MKVIRNDIPDPEVRDWMVGYVHTHNKTIEKNRKREQRKQRKLKSAGSFLTD